MRKKEKCEKKVPRTQHAHNNTKSFFFCSTAYHVDTTLQLSLIIQHCSILRRMETAFIVASALSLTSSLAVSVTCLCFPTFGNKFFIKIIFWMSFCDFMASALSVIGFPKSGSLACQIQSFWCWLFYRAGWVWTVLLAWQLCRLILDYKRTSILVLHSISWGLSLLGTLAPIAGGASYGMIEDLSGQAWCFLAGLNSADFVLWVFLTVQSYVWIGIVLMVAFSLAAYRHHQSATEIVKSDPSFAAIKVAIYQISVYPLLMIVCWGPNMFLFPLYNAGIVGALYFEISLLLGTLNGAIVGLIFFIRSNEARELWKNSIYGAFGFQRQPSRNLQLNVVSSNGAFSETGHSNPNFQSVEPDGLRQNPIIFSYASEYLAG